MIETGQCTISPRSAYGLETPEKPELWQEKGLCAQTDPEAFFPEKGGSTREAKKICIGCPVRRECLDYALDHDERFGIWGGFSERERRRLQRGEQVNPAMGAYKRCDVCGASMYSTAGRGEVRVCSDACRDKIRPPRPEPPALPTHPRRDCKGCGTSFTPQHGHARFCSVACRRKDEYARKAVPAP